MSNINASTGMLKPQASEYQRIYRVFSGRGIVVFGTIVILLTLIVAIFAPFLTPHDPYKMDLANTLAKPGGGHLLGTDTLGRDLFSRIIYGTRISLLVGVIVVSCAAIFGILLGLIAGFFGGWIDIIVMRIVDALIAFPMILLALLIAGLLGGGTINMMIALTIGLIPKCIRLMRGQVLSVKENDYILAARAIGASNSRILFRHLLPNCFAPLLIMMTVYLGMTILAESSLSFLGIGIEPPAIAWGGMVSEGRAYLSTHPLLSLTPGLALMLVVFAFCMVGDGLRDVLDPRLRGLSSSK